MTESKLERLYYISKEIDFLKAKISELNAEHPLKSKELNDMPHGSGENSQVEKWIEKRIQLNSKYCELLTKRECEELRLTTYIESVSDYEVKAIMRMRYIEFMKWNKIAQKMHMDTSYPHKIIKKYLNQ